jgi:hypothetical protein
MEKSVSTSRRGSGTCFRVSVEAVRERAMAGWALYRPLAPLEQVAQYGVEGFVARCLVLLFGWFARFISFRDLSHLSGKLF